MRAEDLALGKNREAFEPNLINSFDASLTHCQTSGWSLTEPGSFNNVTRTAIEALARRDWDIRNLYTPIHWMNAIALPTDFSGQNRQKYAVGSSKKKTGSNCM